MRRSTLLPWALYDAANAGFFTLVQTFVFATYFAKAVAENETAGTALWGDMLGLSGLAIGVAGPVLGAVADRTGRRKPWIFVFTVLCVAATAGLFFIRPDASFVLAALVLAGLGTIGGECANIFYNAMLPALAPPDRIGRWSGWGWGAGYAGGLVCLGLALAGLVGQGAWLPVPQEDALNVRSVCLLSAGWYALLALPLFLFVPDAGRASAPLGASIRQGLAQLADSARHVRRYRHILRFLIARLFYNDGMVTMFAFGGIYAAGTFDMTTDEIILFGIALNVTAGLGSAAFAFMDDRVGARATILVSLVGLLFSGGGMLVVQSKALFWALGMVLGLFVGPVQASSRSYLARVAPPELTNQFFGLFALSGKLTTFAGPLLVGWLTLASGSQRVGMGAVVAFFAIGLVLMLLVPRAPEAVVDKADDGQPLP